MNQRDLEEEERLKRRERALASTYYFSKFVCGFKDLDVDLHGLMSRWVQKPTRFKLGMAPRSTFKSSVWTIGDNLRRATIDPHKKILIVNEVRDNTIKWILYMQAVVLSPTYRWLFPEVVPDPRDVRWNQTQLELRRTMHMTEPTIEGCGVGGASTSSHYNIVDNDDLVGKEARESPSVMQKAIEQYRLSNSLLVNPSEDEIHTFGTRWGPSDLIDWMLKTLGSDLDVLHLKVRKPNGDPIFPSRLPEREILRIKRELGSEFFALQYDNEALGEGVSEFDPAWLNHWSETKLERDGVVLDAMLLEGPRGRRVVALDDCITFQVTDAGLSPESKDARTANVAIALVPGHFPEDPFDIILLDQTAKKCDPPAVVKHSYDMYKRVEPSIWAIESVGGHQVFFHWISDNFPTVRIRKLKTDSHTSKFTRIREFNTFFANRRFYVHRNHGDFMDEYVAFPNGRTVDLLDATAYMPQIWFAPEDRRVEKKQSWFDRTGDEMREEAEESDEWVGDGEPTGNSAGYE